jgi:hypothetical protein
LDSTSSETVDGVGCGWKHISPHWYHRPVVHGDWPDGLAVWVETKYVSPGERIARLGLRTSAVCAKALRLPGVNSEWCWPIR